MSLFKENYDPSHVSFHHTDKNYRSLYKRYMLIHANDTKFNVASIAGSTAFVGGVTLLAIHTSWLLAFLGTLLIVLWMVAPRTRLRVQKKMTFVRQNGTDDYPYRTKHGPTIAWNLAETNSVYREAVTEWLSAVRTSDNISVKQEKWSKYLRETEKLVAEQTPGLEPDFEKLKILKQLMGSI